MNSGRLARRLPIIAVAVVGATRYGRKNKRDHIYTPSLWSGSVVHCEALKVNPDHKMLTGLNAASAEFESNSPIEDRTFMDELEWVGGRRLPIVAVLDGHTGWHVSEFAKNHLLKYVQHEMDVLIQSHDVKDLEAQSPYFLRLALIKAFEKMDQDLLAGAKRAMDMGLRTNAKGGSCACVVVIDRNAILVANIGDSRAVLSRRGKAVPLCTMQNANDPLEQKLLRASHPGESDIIWCKRVESVPRKPYWPWDYPRAYFGLLPDDTAPSACYVKGRLMPTRVFGDFHLKSYEMSIDRATGNSGVKAPYSFPYVTATPVVEIYTRHPQDEFIIVGSDGVWDFIDDQESVDAVKYSRSSDPADWVDKVMEAVQAKAGKEANVEFTALATLPAGERRRKYDDMSVIVLSLKS